MVTSYLHAFKNKLRSTLQGDTPCVASQSKFLGVADGPSDVDDGLILAQVIARGAVATAGVCQISAQLHWPMVARYFFLQQAVSTLDYLLPLCIQWKNAALRLNALQERWAQTVLDGVCLGKRPPLGEGSLDMFVALLWVGAIMGS